MDFIKVLNNFTYFNEKDRIDDPSFMDWAKSYLMDVLLPCNNGILDFDLAGTPLYIGCSGEKACLYGIYLEDGDVYADCAEDDRLSIDCMDAKDIFNICRMIYQSALHYESKFTRDGEFGSNTVLNIF